MCQCINQGLWIGTKLMLIQEAKTSMKLDSFATVLNHKLCKLYWIKDKKKIK